MRITRLLSTSFTAAVLCLAVPVAASAQDWFVPPGGQAGRAAPPPVPRAVARPQPRPQPIQAQPIAPIGPAPELQEEPQQNQPDLQVQLPPPPDLPPIPKGVAPPTAVIGVLGVPEVMRASTAAQQVERVIGERRAKFAEEVQKEQASWRELQQSFVQQRGSLSPEQVRTRERELQERITTAQRKFRDRDRIMQEAARYALAQIERTMVSVIRQVAESRGMNLVLHRTQVALNINEFDVTDAVAQQLNKICRASSFCPRGSSRRPLKPHPLPRRAHHWPPRLSHRLPCRPRLFQQRPPLSQARRPAPPPRLPRPPPRPRLRRLRLPASPDRPPVPMAGPKKR